MKLNTVHRIMLAAAMAVTIGIANVMVLAVPGDPDESYGTTGYYFDDQGGREQETTSFIDGAITSDGKLTSVGTYTYFVENLGFVQDFFVQRVLPNGQRDPQFFDPSRGGPGNAPGSVRLNDLFPRGSQAVARAVVIQPDNKILLAGVCNIFARFGTPDQRQSGYGMCAARLMPNGELDKSFGGNNFLIQHTPDDPTTWLNYTMPAGTTFVHYPGEVETGYAGVFNATNAGALDVALHSDGRIVLAGFGVAREFDRNHVFQGYNHLALLVTLAQSGGLDSVNVTPGDQTYLAARRLRGRAYNQVETQSDGSVVAAGFNLNVDEEGTVIGGRWMVFNGTLPWYSESFPNRGAATSIKLTRSNKILVAGHAYDSGVDVDAMMRFNGDLTPDTTFGTNGRVTYCRGEIPCQILQFSGSGGGHLKLAAVENDGKILALAGDPFNAYNAPYDPNGGKYLVRFNPDGSVDRSFGNAYGNNPANIENFGYSFLFRDMGAGVVQKIEHAPFAALQADGRIVAGGSYGAGGPLLGIAGATRRLNTFRIGILTDFGNDGRSDLSVYRDGFWYTLSSFNNSFSAAQFGLSSDVIAPADYDGDGKTDMAVFRGTNGTWYITQSSNGQFKAVQWGTSGDIPRPGDFNGDGQADIAVFRPSDGYWYVLYSNPIQPGNVTYTSVQFGLMGDIPLIADVDGDGKSDYAVFRQGNWYYLRSTDGQFGSVQFGLSTDIPVTADYDGDSRSDIAVFRPSNGTWYRLQSSTGEFRAINFGLLGDVPVPGDYDNDGSIDVAVYRDGTWYVMTSSDGRVHATQFGIGSDRPIAAAYTQ